MSLSDKYIFETDSLIKFCTRLESSSLEDRTETRLEVDLQTLTDKFAKVESCFQTVYLSDEKILPENFKQSAEGKYDACSDSFRKTKTFILEALKQLQKTSPSFSEEYLNVSRNFFDESISCVKLPHCDTQVFSGKRYEDWPVFRDMFTALYIKRPNLSAMDKLLYLRSKTTGIAADIVEKHGLTKDSFAHAWENLKTRYENKRVLVRNQYEILLNIPAIGSENSESIQNLQSTINNCIASLMSYDISLEDSLLVYICSSKLPQDTLTLWEQSLGSATGLETWAQLDEFLTSRFEVVERLNRSRFNNQSMSSTTRANTKVQFVSNNNTNFSCKSCGKNHALKYCPKFKSMNVNERIQLVKSNNYCSNCLSNTHTNLECQSIFSCMHCKQRHHTMLHFDDKNSNNNPNSQNMIKTTALHLESKQISDSNLTSDIEALPNELNSASSGDIVEVQTRIGLYCSTGDANVYIPTALVYIDVSGEKFLARALIDQGSQRSFISEKVHNQLNLFTKSANFAIYGTGDSVQNSNKLSEFILTNKNSDVKIKTSAIVLKKLTNVLPTYSVENPDISELDGLELADPYFFKSSKIDLILGSDIIPQIILPDVKYGIFKSVMAQNTVFGYIFSGPISTDNSTKGSISSYTIEVKPISDDSISKQLRKFWEVEEVAVSRPQSKEDQYCESLYQKTTYRDSNGRYVVKLPFKVEYPQDLYLGFSRYAALAQYIGQEVIMSKKPGVSETYRGILEEYLSLDHMEPTSSTETRVNGNISGYYLPHHAVFRPESQSTKTRIVFNASKRSSSGLSLNDILYVGPTLQADLILIILNWRLYQFVYNGDIEKMYRQIRVHESDYQYQRILFRRSEKTPIQDFSLKTVTFGVSSAPYLAIRTLHKLAEDSEQQFPIAAKVLRQETYVDDILSGGHDLASTLASLSETTQVLKSAHFPLRKITSNHPQILKAVNSEHLLNSEFLKFPHTSFSKTLGIQWNALTDSFFYTISPIVTSSSATKRQVLSTIAKLFDPAGWLSPVIVQSKCFLQQLWREGKDWDQAITQSSLDWWNEFVRSLQDIEKIEVPRWIKYQPSDIVQIHGFCDASEKAYCAALYLRTKKLNGDIFSNLIVSKNKISPVNQITLPRLELCGAVLLSRLVQSVVSNLAIPTYELFLWSDSSIVLSWLEKPPSTWGTFVANRTSEIVRNVGNIKWRHVCSADNPADLGTRGCSPIELKEQALWWNGPSWLLLPSEKWPVSMPQFQDPPERKKISTFHISCESEDILNRFSSWDKGIRVVSYIFRFLYNTLGKYADRRIYSSSKISQKEFEHSKRVLVILTQKLYFSSEYYNLKNRTSLERTSSLLSLNPFLDEHGVMRSNGRLADSLLSYNERHPVIVPTKSRFCHLFLEFIHKLFLHAEHQLMIRSIRQEYYIPRLKPVVKNCIFRCKTCVIARQKVCQQIMAALPPERCSLSVPFHITGIDFAGPFQVKSSTLRQSPYLKSYVSVFVCFSTKAIHLEICSDLTTESFLAAFTRFISRRGLPKKIMSDNGTNFVGASNTLRFQFKNFLQTAENEVSAKYAAQGFEWSFIPPHAPHMGGLWESAVKSFKLHLRKVAGSQKFTFEEFSTLLARIEAVLNSRPLSPVSDDVTELLALTPGHFLRGSPLLAFPEPDPDNLSLVNRWEKIKILHHQFSIRWRDEYLLQLQKRYKWKSPEKNLEEGQFVIVKEESLPPHEWLMGRIQKIHYGRDNYVRKADVVTQNGTITRPVVKLCILPVA